MSWFRADIERMAGYAPGEQPMEPGWIKLNTNENPYPPSPDVVEALRRAADDRLNLYPDPLATEFRRAAADVLGVEPDWILAGNGSDEILTILARAYCGPGDEIHFPYPSYILYETLAELQGVRGRPLLLHADWSFPDAATIARALGDRTKLCIVPNPNSPSGNRWDPASLLACLPKHGMLVLDGAYADFAEGPTGLELLKSPAGERVILTRTFSKSYSLAGIRFGFAVARPEVIAGLRKVKDSYNCDRLALVAATAAMRDQSTMLENVRKISATRHRLATALTDLGFSVAPSEANFVWATHPARSHRELHHQLKDRKILVRFMTYRDVPWAPGGTLDGLRITVGSDAEIDRFLVELRSVMSAG